MNIPLASTASETRVKDLRQTSNVKPGLETRVYELKEECAAGGNASATPSDIHDSNADNPFAAHYLTGGTPSVTGEVLTPEALRRKLAPLESLAKAVGIVCIIYAIFDGSLAVYDWEGG